MPVKMLAKICHSAIQFNSLCITIWYFLMVMVMDNYITRIKWKFRIARRNHRISDSLINYITEPHKGIIGNERIPLCLSMTSRTRGKSRNCLDLVKAGSNSIKSSTFKIMETNTLEKLDK
jgi:hypothetical protein